MPTPLITPTFYKQYVGGIDPTDTSNDTQIQLLIAAASAAFCSMTNRRNIAATSYTDTVNGDGSGTLILRNTPVLSIQSVSMDGLPVVPYANGIGWALGDDGFTLLMPSGQFNRGFRNVAVTYTAGYDPVPDDVQGLIAEMVKYKMAKLPRIDKVSETLPTAAGMSTSFSQKDLPVGGQSIVTQYTTRCVYR